MRQRQRLLWLNPQETHKRRLVALESYQPFFSLMTYEQQILNVLTEAGERGIGVQTIARHVYNMNCTLFHTPDFTEIHQFVQQYLLRNSKSSQSLIEATGRRGYYRLNTQGSADARQLMLQFREEQQQTEAPVEAPPQDLSLNLFDD